MITLQKGQGVIVAYNGTERVGHAALDGPRGRWTIRVGGTVRYTRRRRAAARKLHKLAVAHATARAIARSPLPARREAIGGGVQQIGGTR